MRLTSRALAAAVGIAALAGFGATLPASFGAAQSPPASPVRAVASTPSTPASAAPATRTASLLAVRRRNAPRRVLWGAYIDGSMTPSAVSRFEAQARKKMSLISWVTPWYYAGAPQSFETSLMSAARHEGAIPVIDWAPWDEASGSPNQPAFRLRAIAAGRYDAYIRTWATAARRWGHPFFLRFGEEMNGNWYSWGVGANHNTAADFVAAWRHVHTIFRHVGARNATWVWNPNTDFPGFAPLRSVYPGNAYVDWVAIDGYNWGTDPVKQGTSWQSFRQVFGQTYRELGAIAPAKPVMLAEVASTEYGGSKAAWIRDALGREIPSAFPRIKAVVWFNSNLSDSIGPETWTINTSLSAESAFAATIASGIYQTNHYAHISRSPIPAP